MGKAYQICNRCVMDTSDPDIIFDENGICNHCKQAIEKVKAILFIDENERKARLNSIIKKIKPEGVNKKYDCIIGLSGGVDSSYLAYIAHKLGLKPLAVHIDNGWNSALSIKNIENIVKKLNFDLYTLVLDWEEFRNLQRAFFKASVVDLEMLSDNAIIVGINKVAKKEKIKYFLSGTNLAAESIMPSSWYYSYKYDSLNIKSIYKSFGNGKKISTYPLYNFFEYFKHRYFKNISEIPLLNYVKYVKEEAIQILKKELDWRDYGGKHHESKITQFYQAYILPEKFKIDKRRAHLSSLICSDQITREQALHIIKTEKLYTSENLQIDKEYFIKKLELSEDEFENIMRLPIKKHSEYAAYNNFNLFLSRIKRKIIHKPQQL